MDVYDTTKAIQLNKNYIAQSAHFRVEGSSTTSTTTSATANATTVTPSPSDQSKSGLSPGAAAGIGVSVTLVVAILCLFGGFCWLRRRTGWSKKTNGTFSLVKPELEGRAGPIGSSLSVTEKDHEPIHSQRATDHHTDNVDDTFSSRYHEAATSSPVRVAQPSFHRSGSDVLPVTAYEIHSKSRNGNPPELPDTSPLGTTHREELPVDDHSCFNHAPNERQDGMTMTPQVLRT